MIWVSKKLNCDDVSRKINGSDGVGVGRAGWRIRGAASACMSCSWAMVISSGCSWIALFSRFLYLFKLNQNIELFKINCIF